MEPRLSLGLLIFGAIMLDILFGLFLLSGIEHAKIVPGATGVSPFEFYGAKLLDEIKISVIATDSFSSLQLAGQVGMIDQNTAIFGYDDRFREWCKKLFLYFWEKKGSPC